MASHPPRRRGAPNPGSRPMPGSLPCPPSMNTRPAATFHRAAPPGSSHHGDGEILRLSVLDGPPPEAESVHSPGRPVYECLVVVFPARLVLFRAVVVVDTEDDGLAWSRPGPHDPGYATCKASTYRSTHRPRRWTTKPARAVRSAAAARASPSSSGMKPLVARAAAKQALMLLIVSAIRLVRVSAAVGPLQASVHALASRDPRCGRCSSTKRTFTAETLDALVHGPLLAAETVCVAKRPSTSLRHPRRAVVSSWQSRDTSTILGIEFSGYSSKSSSQCAGRRTPRRLDRRRGS